MNLFSSNENYKLYQGDMLDMYRVKTENGYIIEGRRGNDTIFKMLLSLNG